MFVSMIFQNDVCRINNKCYADGFIDPTNANQICDVTSSKTQWATLNGKLWHCYQIYFAEWENLSFYMHSVLMEVLLFGKKNKLFC